MLGLDLFEFWYLLTSFVFLVLNTWGLKMFQGAVYVKDIIPIVFSAFLPFLNLVMFFIFFSQTLQLKKLGNKRIF